MATRCLLLFLTAVCASSVTVPPQPGFAATASPAAAQQAAVRADAGPTLSARAMSGRADRSIVQPKAAARVQPRERLSMAKAVTDYLKQVFADRPEALAKIQEAWDKESAEGCNEDEAANNFNRTAGVLNTKDGSSEPDCPACQAIHALYEAGHPRFESRMHELVVGRGYPLERHTVVTPDGYELVMFRIPHGAQRNTKPGNKPVVLLHHGISLASDSYALFNQNESLAFIMADAGFDVWLANTRGNTYSRRNVNLYTYQPEFWYFAIDQLALLDLPTQVDFVLKASGASKIGYVGHSQGAGLALMLCAAKPEYNRKFSVIAAMGPVIFAQFLQQPFLRLAVNLFFDQLLYISRIGEYLPNRLTAPIATTLCSSFPINEICAAAISFFSFGPSSFTTPDDYLEIARTWPSSIGARNMVHWSQNVRARNLELRHYNYGTTCEAPGLGLFPRPGKAPFRESCNQEQYGSATPPAYNLSQIKAPIVYFMAEHDLVSTPPDIQEQQQRIGSANAGTFVYSNYGHMDFVWDRNAKQAADVVDVLFRFSAGTFR